MSGPVCVSTFANDHEISAVSEERARVQRRVGGFNWRGSRAWAHLSYIYGPKLSQDELVSIAELVTQALPIKLDRDVRHRKVVMVKWFEENWMQIHSLLYHVVLDRSDT
jgi:hypothetical protein